MRSVAGTELSREQYLIHLNADYQLLASAIPESPVDVPSCPGWSTNDLAKHMAHVYLGQAFVVETVLLYYVNGIISVITLQLSLKTL